MPRRDSTEPAEVRRGFTLVELLVVVGIVSVLIAILMPALNRAREHADRVKCAANLRSIGQALTMYVQQYGRYPACQLYDSGHSPAVWPVRLRPFTNGDRGVFHCPSQDESREWRRQGAPPGGTPRWATHSHARYGYEPGELLLDWEWVPFSYGYNITGADGGFSRPPVEQLGLGVKLIVDDPAHRSSGEVRAGQVRAPS